MNDELEHDGDRIIRDAEWVGVWFLVRRGLRKSFQGVKGFHRHHQRVWFILAALSWATFAGLCILGVIVMIHIQTTQGSCQLMGTCKWPSP